MLRLLSLILLATATHAHSQGFEELDLLLDKLTLSPPKPVIGGISSGFGASSGVAYVSVSYADQDLQTNIDGDDDGSIMTGIGFGDPRTAVGAELTLTLTSVSSSLWGDGKFADEGNISFKLHKLLPPTLGDVASLSLGASNIAGWGSTTENPINYYATYSEITYFGTYQEYATQVTFGYGSGVSDMETTGDLFFGAAIGYDDFSASIAQTGNEGTVSFTYFPPLLNGLSINYTKAGAFGDTSMARNILSFSISTQLGNNT